ncbi:NAD(P)H-hydrate dehydratase [Lutibacter sp.]|uniref:NAD(P)H-hydrate dehydratase n=1 Tax=Lutibacter sp. TaxID=1925666 RepID=UPI002734FF55|nr:NAD(P)H-hydrate dehydratase [Lutibacter sp.]MDP3312439.1 NAD(P)H-hydrate dehydratase [Lutibacter sp.]
MFILSSNQFSLADKATIKTKKISSLDLMEHAATLCFQWIHKRLEGQPIKIHLFCGVGNNGGDGLVIARLLKIHGYQVFCYVVNFSDKRTDEFLTNYANLKEVGIWPSVINNEDPFPLIDKDDLIIDAIFGNGLSRKPAGFTKKLIQYLNTTNAFILSIDIPSGLFGDKSVNDKNSVIKSNHILTFQGPKLAFLLAENKEYVQTWEVLDIGLDADFINSLNPTIHFIQKEDILSMYKPRNKWDHKGTFGHSLIIGGSFGKIGAVVLASKAALKIGSGLVSAYIPKCGYEIMQISLPEAMVEVDDDQEVHYFNFKTKPNVIGIGPGLGTSEKTSIGFANFLLDNKTPLVIDADALNIMAQHKTLFDSLPEKSVITPHPKELERLIGAWENDYDKLEKTKELSIAKNCIIVIKGAHTVIIDGSNFYFNSSGNPALATAGSGDVLTGLITGCIAQGYSALNAAILGVYLHGKTADIGVTHLGYESFIASSILDFLSDAILDLFNTEDPPKTNTETESMK